MKLRPRGLSVVIVCSGLHRGGAERVISQLASHWATMHRVTVVPLLFKECEYPIGEDVKIEALCPRVPRLLAIPGWIRGIRRIARREAADVVVSFFPKNSILAYVATRGCGCRFVSSERNDPRYDGRGVITKCLSSFVYRRSDGTVFQTSEVMSLFRNCRNAMVIPNPVTNRVESVYTERRVPGKVVSVGRLSAQKNRRLLLRSFARVHKHIPDANLTIYGDGEERESLEAIVASCGLEDCVSMPGNVPDVLECIADSDLFVLSSDYEGMSNALLEAVSLGLACVSTDCAGVRDIITSPDEGVVVPVGDEDALADAMKQLLENGIIRQRISDGARRRGEWFRSDAVLRRWDEFVFSLVKERPVTEVMQ